MTNGADPERFHPQYHGLHAELLARPFPVVAGQVMVSHRLILFAPGEAAEHRAAVAALADSPGVVAVPEELGFQLLRLGEVDLRIERHTEFTTFTVFAPQTGVPFAESAIDQLPEGFLDAIPGKILAAVEIACELVAALDAGTVKTMERVLEYFDQENLVGGWVVERVASVWSHFRPDERGATRFLVQIHRLTSGRYGRLLQRLVEIENYRMAAMLGLPLARDVFPRMEELEARHVSLVERIGAMDDTDARALLADLTDLSLATGRLQARCSPRFSRTESYARILAARVGELREEQVPGYQTLGGFFGRRLPQAWHTCEQAQAGLDALAAGIQATTGLLRTRVAVSSPSQNLQLSAEQPVRLQPTAEVPQAVILTYYLAILLNIVLEGISGTGIRSGASLCVALAVPPLAWLVWKAVRKARGGHR